MLLKELALIAFHTEEFIKFKTSRVIRERVCFSLGLFFMIFAVCSMLEG